MIEVKIGQQTLCMSIVYINISPNSDCLSMKDAHLKTDYPRPVNCCSSQSSQCAVEIDNHFNVDPSAEGYKHLQCRFQCEMDIR